MRILIAFIVAFGIGAGSRWTGVPSLAPQVIVGALLIVAMSTGWVTAERTIGAKMQVSAVTPGKLSLSAHEVAEQEAANEHVSSEEKETSVVFLRKQSEGLRLIIADLLRTNEEQREKLQASGRKQPE